MSKQSKSAKDNKILNLNGIKIQCNNLNKWIQNSK